MANVVFDEESARRIAAAVKWVEQYSLDESTEGEQEEPPAEPSTLTTSFLSSISQTNSDFVTAVSLDGELTYVESVESAGTLDVVTSVNSGNQTVVTKIESAGTKTFVTSVAGSGDIVTNISGDAEIVTNVACVNGDIVVETASLASLLATTTSDASSLITTTTDTVAIADLATITSDPLDLTDVTSSIAVGDYLSITAATKSLSESLTVETDSAVTAVDETSASLTYYGPPGSS